MNTWQGKGRKQWSLLVLLLLSSSRWFSSGARELMTDRECFKHKTSGRPLEDPTSVRVAPQGL